MYPTERYGDLRVIARIVKIIAWIALIVGIVGALMALTSLSDLIPGGGPRIGIALVVLLAVGVSNFLQLYIISGLLSVFVDMEYNTRAQTEVVERLLKATEKA